MRGRKNPAANETPPNLPPCKICGEQGTGFHYGVTACGACKGFFRRSLVRKESYLCIGSGNCVIGPETKRRKSCPKCRHDKCLAVGMSKEAIKTGRYSYVKKSHDIIEMIEHHFQHYVKRKQFAGGKIAGDGQDQDFEIPRKKSRASCALEKVSVVFRQPGSEFMELSPSKPTAGVENSFHFDNINYENGGNFGINNLSEMTIPEDVRLAMSEDISVSNDFVGPCLDEQGSVGVVNNGYRNSSVDFRDSGLLHYLDSQSSQAQQTVLVPSPLSLASPRSEASTSKESLASLSPPWMDFPVFSESSYSDSPPEGRNNYFSYPDRDHEGDLEFAYGKPHRFEDKEDLQYPDLYSVHLSGTGFDYPVHNEIAHNFSSPTITTHDASEVPANSHTYNFYNQQNASSQASQLTLAHTPVSNELEQLRRLSWDDVNFDDQFLSPGYDYFPDTTKPPLNKSSIHSNGNQACYHDNINNFSCNVYENKEVMSQDMGSSYYWDMDNTAQRIQEGNPTASKDKTNGQFNFIECTNMNKSFIYSDPLSMYASYYRDRHGSDSSTSSLAVDNLLQSPVNVSTQHSPPTVITQHSPTTGSTQHSPTTLLPQHSPTKASPQHSKRDTKMVLSDNTTGIITKGYTKEGIHPLFAEIQPRTSVISTATSPSSLLPFLLKEDYEQSLNVNQAALLPSSVESSKTSNEPLNFLNIPIQTDSQNETNAFPRLDVGVALSNIHSSTEFSSDDDEIFSQMTTLKPELTRDNEFLERWTPFSLEDETLTPMEHEKKCERNVRLQDNEDDYRNKVLPFCEYTEAELDEVVRNLKTSHQKHVVQDTNLLSDEEIAEKLQAFLDIVQLREETFGKCASINREDYFNILEATGIDLGGRREWVETTAKIFNRTLQKTIRFFRSVPGFKDICHEDKTILAKSCMYEYIILSCYRGVNVEEQVILDAEHKLAFNMDFVRPIFPEMEEHFLDIFEFSRKLTDLRLSFEETLILKAITILSPDRDKLKEFDKVYRMYWRLHCCLLLSLWRRLDSSPWQFYARVISALTDLRQLAFNGRQLMCNYRPDILKLTKDIQVPLYLELMFTRADSIPDAELK